MDNLLARVLEMCSAKEAAVSYSGGTTALTRFAENQTTQNTSRTVRTLSLTVTLDGKSGTAATTDVTDAGLRRVVDRAHEIATLVPPDPEYVEPLGPQKHRTIAARDEATAALTPAERAAMANAAVDAAGDLRASGTVSSGDTFTMLMNKNGLAAEHRATSAGFSVTMRTPDGRGSSRAEISDLRRAGDIDAAALARRTAERARASVGGREIPPGEYTVVMEPQAVADVLGVLGWFMDQRAADEGRSFFSGKLDQKIVNERVTLRTDVERHLGSPFDGEGLPIDDGAWIEKGVLKRLPTSRYWAKKMNRPTAPGLSSLVIPGDDRSVDDLVAETPRGLLLTRFWYIRTVDQKKILMTGLTRDGSFLIEDGKVVGPVINYRWNESPIAVLSNIEAMSREQKVGGWMVPGLRVTGFTLTSPSKAV